MFSKAEIEKMLFFDVETAGSAADMTGLSERMQELWRHRCEYLTSDKYPENQGMGEGQLFSEKAGLQAEFGRVVGISFGRVKFSEDPNGKPLIQIASYFDEDEETILKEAIHIFNGMHKHKMIPIGHNIKRFDIPYLCKRWFINGMEPALPLQVWDKKPWEINVKDTSELWSFGAWQEGFTSLDLLTAVLGLPSPKDQMKGDQVHSMFYSGKLEEIRTYCNKDVIALIRIIFSLSSINQFEESSINYK